MELFNGCQREVIRETQLMYYSKPGTRRDASKPRCEEYKRFFGAAPGGYPGGGYYL